MIYFAIISILFSSLGQVLVKLGATKIPTDTVFNMQYITKYLLLNKYIVSGLFLYGLSFLMWIKVLTKLELSYAYPLISISYIVIFLASYFLFKEPFTIQKLIGSALILTGVIVMGFK